MFSIFQGLILCFQNPSENSGRNDRIGLLSMGSGLHDEFYVLSLYTATPRGLRAGGLRLKATVHIVFRKRTE